MTQLHNTAFGPYFHPLANIYILVGQGMTNYHRDATANINSRAAMWCAVKVNRFMKRTEEVVAKLLHLCKT